MNSETYQINYGPIEGNYRDSDRERELLERLNEKLQSSKDVTEASMMELEDAVEEFPDNPSLKYLLGMIYMQLEETDVLDVLLDEMQQKHPDYLPGKILAADVWLSDFRPEDAAAIMKGFISLTEVCPGQNRFHITDVERFHSLAVYYHMYVDNDDEALEHLKFLQQCGVEKQAIKLVAELGDLFKINGKAARLTMDENNLRGIEGTARYLDKQTKKRPVFNHKLIEVLYHVGFDPMPEELLKELLTLPRNTLIEDLENVLKDAIHRFEFFNLSLDEDDDDLSSFVIHAMQLLGELRSYESLPLILDLLRQDSWFEDFWFGDMSEAFMRRPFYLLGRERLSLLHDFLKEPGIWWAEKCLVNSMLENIAILDADRHGKVVAIFSDMLDFFWENREDETVFDSVVVADIAGILGDLRANVLMGSVKRFYDAGLADLTWTGPWTQIVEDFQYPDTLTPLPLPSLAEEYDNFTEDEWDGDYFYFELNEFKKKRAAPSLYEQLFPEDRSPF